MKAIVIRRYGAPDALSLEDTEQPRPGPGQVLVGVHAASINSWDWGQPHFTPKRSSRPMCAIPASAD
jgi:NADPH:quinone reductase-like Zn-dependent oxidoreductase